MRPHLKQLLQKFKQSDLDKFTALVAKTIEENFEQDMELEDYFSDQWFFDWWFDRGYRWSEDLLNLQDEFWTAVAVRIDRLQTEGNFYCLKVTDLKGETKLAEKVLNSKDVFSITNQEVVNQLLKLNKLKLEDCYKVELFESERLDILWGEFN